VQGHIHHQDRPLHPEPISQVVVHQAQGVLMYHQEVLLLIGLPTLLHVVRQVAQAIVHRVARLQVVTLHHEAVLLVLLDRRVLVALQVAVDQDDRKKI